MPILRDDCPVIYPESNYQISKYLDLTKFISLLQNSSLFFCRLDILEDKFEGTVGEPNLALRKQISKELMKLGKLDVPNEEEFIEDFVKARYDWDLEYKKHNCVNCWNKKSEESAALWKIYSDFSKGILIKSSISRLENSLKDTKEKIRLSEVRYIDYKADTIPEGNLIYPLIHKHQAYSYEDELRLIFDKGQCDWNLEEINEGINIKVNLDELIEEIIISPYSPKWFQSLIKDLTEKYKLVKEIKKSALSFN